MEETINMIVQLINGCGFPIAACIGIFYLYNKSITSITNTLTKLDSTLDNVASTLEKIDAQTSKEKGE